MSRGVENEANYHGELYACTTSLGLGVSRIGKKEKGEEKAQGGRTEDQDSGRRGADG